MKTANFRIVWTASSPERLVIQDEGPWNEYLTVTNDAEGVVRELYQRGYLAEGRRLFYYDSDDNCDEIVHEAGKFVGFRPGSSQSLTGPRNEHKCG